MRQLRWKWSACDIHATASIMSYAISIGSFTTAENWLHFPPNSIHIATNFLHHISTFKCVVFFPSRWTWTWRIVLDVCEKKKNIFQRTLNRALATLISEQCMRLKKNGRILAQNVYQYPNLVSVSLNRHLYHLLKCQNGLLYQW